VFTVLEVSGGAAAQVDTSAAEALKLETATNLQEQFCVLKRQYEDAANLFGANQTDANNVISCSGQHTLDSNDRETAEWQTVCAADNAAACYNVSTLLL
jgi:hypothetical protein